MSICGGSAGDPAAKRRSPSSTGSPAAIPMRGVRRAATKRHADEPPPNNGRGTWQDVRRQGRSPRVDDRDPADAIHEMVSHVLGLAETWVAWDGKPVAIDDREDTPHKAIRRVAAHLIDHLPHLATHFADVSPFRMSAL